MWQHRSPARIMASNLSELKFPPGFRPLTSMWCSGLTYAFSYSWPVAVNVFPFSDKTRGNNPDDAVFMLFFFYIVQVLISAVGGFNLADLADASMDKLALSCCRRRPEFVPFPI